MRKEADMQRRQWLKRTLASVVALFSVPAKTLTSAPEQSTGANKRIATLHKVKFQLGMGLTPSPNGASSSRLNNTAFSSRSKRSGRSRARLITKSGRAPTSAPLATSRSLTRKRNSTAGPAGQASTSRSKGALTRSVITGSSCREPNTTVNAAAATRVTFSAMGRRQRGQRWCNNGVALKFVPQGEPLPPLRT